MEQLIDGLHHFRSQVFLRERELFEQLAQGQSPSTLFITCSDSRICPNLLTGSGPGELFVMRNAGNIAPSYMASNGGEAATIEYAVAALKVSNIVVCGHSGCGALKALLDPQQTDSLPLVRQWLQHAEGTRRILMENYPQLTPEARLDVAAQEHVLVQLENLQTHPSVLAAVHRGALELHAWVYELTTGDVAAYCSETGQFCSLREAKATTRQSPMQKRSSPRAKKATKR